MVILVKYSIGYLTGCSGDCSGECSGGEAETQYLLNVAQRSGVEE